MNYVVYDFETTGRNSIWDQIIQVGAILVNENFEEMDRFELRCRLRPGLIPEPGALIVNKTTPDMLRSTNLSQYKFILQLNNKFKQWSPATFVGYNSISFDEEFLRNSLFKTLKNPYLTSLDGNKRADFLGLVRNAHIYYPECINTPINEKGNSFFKLDQLAPLNGIDHLAHDAMEDVVATIELGKIISKKAPEVWQSSLKTTSKKDVDSFIYNEKLICINEFFFGKAKSSVVSYICNHPNYNYPQCFDLKHDPKLFFDMSTQELAREMKKSPKIIRSIKNNKHPILMNYNYYLKFPEYKDIGLEILLERSEAIKLNDVFKSKVSRILQEESEEKDISSSQEEISAEESIYKGGFTSNHDKGIMDEFHKAEWKDKAHISDKFKDQRFFYFARRLIYEESPNSLPKDIYNEIHRSIAKQVLSTGNEKWNTIPKAYAAIDDLRNKHVNNYRDTDSLKQIVETSKEDNNYENFLNLLNDYDKFFSEIENSYEDA